jgi:hypothetical protein
MCSHEVKTDEKTQHTAVHVTVKAGDVELVHVMTIGSADEPLPTNYDKAALQRDLDLFREKHAALAEGKLRAKSLAKEIV